ncbi:MAG TPA: DUF4870 domain-containing protein [Candidatus Dormibacteraeota bacterium]|nr:DUF4870 domain-containing protein [Candidatus Dormibacteraeota bacterium]
MGGGAAASSSNKNLYTILAWALFPPIGSLIFLFVGKDDPDVKNNAANALLVHGAMLAVYIILWVISIIVWPLAILATIWWVVWFVVWLVGLILALQAGGRRVNFPVLGSMVASYVPAVEGWAK